MTHLHGSVYLGAGGNDALGDRDLCALPRLSAQGSKLCLGDSHKARLRARRRDRVGEQRAVLNGDTSPCTSGPLAGWRPRGGHVEQRVDSATMRADATKGVGRLHGRSDVSAQLALQRQGEAEHDAVAFGERHHARATREGARECL